MVKVGASLFFFFVPVNMYSGLLEQCQYKAGLASSASPHKMVFTNSRHDITDVSRFVVIFIIIYKKHEDAEGMKILSSC